ncbi:hypothetical protein D3C84_927990 [compost metagenome]
MAAQPAELAHQLADKREADSLAASIRMDGDEASGASAVCGERETKQFAALMGDDGVERHSQRGVKGRDT